MLQGWFISGTFTPVEHFMLRFRRYVICFFPFEFLDNHWKAKYKLAYFTSSNVETKKKRTLISYKWIMLPFQSKNGITAMASFARDTRLITADSAGLFYSHLYGSCYPIVWNNCKLKCSERLAYLLLFLTFPGFISIWDVEDYCLKGKTSQPPEREDNVITCSTIKT